MKSLLTLGLCDFSFSFPPSFYVGFSRSNREIVPTFHEGLLRASRSGKNLYRLPLHFMALFLLRRFRSIRPRFLGPGLFQRGVDGGVVGFQHFLFPFQTHIDVPGGDGFKVHGEAQRRADTGEGMAQHLTDRREVPGQLVHVRGRRVPQIVITDMRHIQPGQQFAEAGGNPVCRLGRTVVFRHNKFIIIEGLSLLCCRLLLCGFSSSPMESPLFPWNRGI